MWCDVIWCGKKKYDSLGRTPRLHIQGKFDKLENISYNNNESIGALAAD